jgi:hypothetical protein
MFGDVQRSNACYDKQNNCEDFIVPTITTAEVRAFITNQLPDAILQTFINSSDAADSCLANYDLADDDIKSLKLLAVAHIITLTERGDISSQSAPNGASRSFKQNAGIRSTSYGMALESLVGGSCVASAIDSSNKVFLMSIKGLS